MQIARPEVGLSPEMRDALSAMPEMFTVCTGTEECSKAVRRLGAEGVDLIKFMATGGVLDSGDIGLEQHFSDAEKKATLRTAPRGSTRRSAPGLVRSSTARSSMRTASPA